MTPAEKAGTTRDKIEYEFAKMIRRQIGVPENEAKNNWDAMIDYIEALIDKASLNTDLRKYALCVLAMRRRQKEYFKTRDYEVLKISKNLEDNVDTITQNFVSGWQQVEMEFYDGNVS